MKEAILVKLQIENLFLLTIKFLKNLGGSNEEKNPKNASSIFIKMAGPIAAVKKICIDEWLGKYYCILKNPSKARGWRTKSVCFKYG